METILVVSSILLWLVVLLNLLLTFGLVRRFNAEHRIVTTPHQVGLKIGELAPNFTAPTLRGEMVTLSTYAGRKVVFVFISAHCDPCHEILPDLQSLGPKAARAGVEFVLVSSNDMEETRTLVEKEHIRLPVLVAPRSTTSFFEDYKATEVPSYCLVNEQGSIQSSGHPYQGWEAWKTLTNSWETRDGSTIIGRR